MAKCAICGKSVQFGKQISHSHRRSNKMWKPNLKKVRVNIDGTHKRIYVCTNCLKGNKVERV
ncbi:MAG: 50S ribosomal protein L28 [Lachnospiraceae bacterium]|nr:50S ribosomal protein L28 [Lachnospiraceae bacterium]